MRILFLTNVPAPYRVDFFNELGKNSELTVLFEKITSDERDSSWKDYTFENFQGVFLKGYTIDVDTAFCPEVVKYLDKNKYDHIIVTDFLTPTGMLAIQYMRLRRIEYWLESDGGFPKNGKGIKEKIKKYYIKGAKGYFSTADMHDKYYIRYGADPKKIFRYPFTSLKKIDTLPMMPSLDEKIELRKHLALSEKKIIISIGQFFHKARCEKEFDILCRVAKMLNNDYGIYIISNEPVDEFLREKENRKLDNLHFIDFQKKEDLSLYYRAADVFLLLSGGDLWKSVINEAMAHGLPIISSDKIIAGTELIRNDENGYMVSLDDENFIIRKIKEITDKPELQYEMSQKSRKIISNYSIEKTPEEHYQILCGGGYKKWIKKYCKKKIGMDDKKVVLAVGQFIHRKGFDVLLNAIKEIDDKNINFIIVGGDAPDSYIKYVSDNHLDNVYFIEFSRKEVLKKYYEAADVFVHPTREDIWGLVINEAIMHFCPVISTDCCIAALQLVHQNENGLIIQKEDSVGLAVAIKSLIKDERVINCAKLDALLSQEYIIERMADRHLEILSN